MYNRALSQDEVQFLYKSNLNKYTADDWLFTTANTCLADDSTYYYTGYAESSEGDFYAIWRYVNTDIPAFNVTWMIDYDFGTLSVSSSAQVVTWEYTTYIEFQDWKAEPGRRITVQFSDYMSWQNNPSLTISWDNFGFQYSALDHLSGFDSDYISINSALSSYTNIVSPINYIERSASTDDFMCNAWIYWDMPQFELTIPAYQIPDVYSWDLTIDIPVI